MTSAFASEAIILAVIFEHLENPRALSHPELNQALQILENDRDEPNHHFENPTAAIASLIPHVAYEIQSPETLNIAEFTQMMSRIFKRKLGNGMFPASLPATPTSVISIDICCLVYAHRLATIYDVTSVSGFVNGSTSLIETTRRNTYHVSTTSSNSVTHFATSIKFFDDVAQHLLGPVSSKQILLRETILVCDAALHCHSRLSKKLVSRMGRDDARQDEMDEGKLQPRKKARKS